MGSNLYGWYIFCCLLAKCNYSYELSFTYIVTSSVNRNGSFSGILYWQLTGKRKTKEHWIAQRCNNYRCAPHFVLMISSFESTKSLWKPHSAAQRSLGQLAILLPGDWLAAICLCRAAAAAACGAGTVTVGAGAPCFTVFVASMVLSAPCGMILFEDVGTKETN